MTEAYNDALAEQMQQNVWDRVKAEATNMSKLEYATLTADIAGIFDPTPTSDAAGFVLSAVQLDAVGALLSLGSMVPYLGDAAAKPLKIAKYAPKTAKALEAFLKAGDNLAKGGKAALKKAGLTLDQVAAARKKALERVKKAMLDARNKVPNCVDCAKLKGAGKKRRLQMPRSKKGQGKWDTPDGNAPNSGNGTYKFDEPKTLPDGSTVDSIEYRDGYPVLDDYAEGGKHELWDVSGNASTDGDRLTNMMRETDPNWTPPNSDDFVLHHFEDGSVGYVPRSVHDVAEGGVAHTGGNSMVNNELF